MRGRTRNFTEEEYYKINDEFRAAEERGDEAEMARIFSLIPMRPKVVRAFARAWGKDFIIGIGVDLTEANIAFGEGWLDELED